MPTPPGHLPASAQGGCGQSADLEYTSSDGIGKARGGGRLQDPDSIDPRHIVVHDQTLNRNDTRAARQWMLDSGTCDPARLEVQCS